MGNRERESSKATSTPSQAASLPWDGWMDQSFGTTQELVLSISAEFPSKRCNLEIHVYSQGKVSTHTPPPPPRTSTQSSTVQTLLHFVNCHVITGTCWKNTVGARGKPSRSLLAWRQPTSGASNMTKCTCRDRIITQRGV